MNWSAMLGTLVAITIVAIWRLKRYRKKLVNPEILASMQKNKRGTPFGVLYKI